VVEVNMADRPARACAADLTGGAAAGCRRCATGTNGDRRRAAAGIARRLASDHRPVRALPHVLPALLRYVNNHPSLSYWFANECRLGPAGPAARRRRARTLTSRVTLAG
jgi:uncharacterized protein (DUF2126 family)